VGNYAFNAQALWGYVKVGLPRALGRIMMLGIGAATIHLITSKGGDYLIVLSIGASIVIFLSFIGEGLHQAMLTLVSHFIGANQMHLRWKLLRSGFLFLLILGAILSVPLIFFPDFILNFFFKEPLTGHLRQILHATCYWVWFHTLGFISQSIFAGFLFAMKDTLFYLVVGFFSWLTSFLPLYCAINIWGWSPDKIWAVWGGEVVIFSLTYCLRLRYIRRKELILQSVEESVSQ
jgi:MATE family multidrug resistance protein